MTYSSSLALSRSRLSGRNQNAISFRPTERTLGPVSNTVILIVLACLLGLVYLTQVTKTNSYGYTINSLQQQQSQLQNEYSNLEVASASLQAPSRVQNSNIAKNMVTIVPSGAVAQ